MLGPGGQGERGGRVAAEEGVAHAGGALLIGLGRMIEHVLYAPGMSD